MTFVLYLAAALSCLRRASLERGLEQGMPRAWILLAVSLLLLGLNKQLDLQTALTALGRQLAMKAGCYQYRREFQLLFLVTLAVAAILIARIQSKALIRFVRLYPACSGGCALIALYCLVQAFSFEHVDRWLGFDPGKVQRLWVIEVTGLCLVLGGARSSAGKP